VAVTFAGTAVARRIGEAALESPRSEWHDASMSENTGRRLDSPNFGADDEHRQAAPKADAGRPTTQPMRTVSQRRRDSEEKLERHLRAARTKPAG
jgi:hypothetical protein